MIGEEVADPKLGFDFKCSLNSAHTSALIHSLPDFKDDGFYFFVAVRSDSPQELKSALDEFVNTGLALAKEMSPEVEGLVGDTPIITAVSGNNVVIAVNLKQNTNSVDLVEFAELASTSIIQKELTFSLGVVVSKSFPELLKDQGLTGSTANFHTNLISTIGDKYSLKSFLINLDVDPAPHAPSIEDKWSKLMFLMFHSFSFKIHQKQEWKLDEVLGDQVKVTQNLVNEFVNQGREQYQQNKELFDSFPFVRAFFDAVEQYGNGRLEVGISHKALSVELQLFGSEFGELYRRITSD